MKQNILLFCLATQRTFTHALWKQLKTIPSNYAEFRIQNLRNGTLQSACYRQQRSLPLSKSQRYGDRWKIRPGRQRSLFLLPDSIMARSKRCRHSREMLILV